jgi:hypothetical protein
MSASQPLGGIGREDLWHPWPGSEGINGIFLDWNQAAKSPAKWAGRLIFDAARDRPAGGAGRAQKILRRVSDTVFGYLKTGLESRRFGRRIVDVDDRPFQGTNEASFEPPKLHLTSHFSPG